MNQKQYELIEVADQTKKTADLLSWSENYDFPTPASLFLDLIGYSEDVYGTTLCRSKQPALGYLELGMLGEALLEYSEIPQTVNDFVSAWDQAGSDEEDN